MTQAYKCDRCEELYGESKQRFGVKLHQNTTTQFSRVIVGEGADLCPKCVIWALEEALKQGY